MPDRPARDKHPSLLKQGLKSFITSNPVGSKVYPLSSQKGFSVHFELTAYASLQYEIDKQTDGKKRENEES
jgi:hypothetical protein